MTAAEVQRNPWFEQDVLPELKKQMRRAIDD
jgi:hypothetical protein